ncbi:MAG: M3 family oligoendopeptidase, partial [Candidatus Dadabacteria bacterium]|nr:M3 family oligoendopeptidase [Candidatus Dadabacteria bacterium]
STKLTSDQLLKAIKEIESISEKCGKILSFAHLLFAADTSDPKIGAFLQSTQEKITQIRKILLFFDLEWVNLPDKRAKIYINDPILKKYKHYLEHERAYKPHTLSEAEEKIMAEKSNTGSKAFSRLFDEIINNIEFDVRINGKLRKLKESQTLSLMYDSNRNTRRSASKGLTKGLVENSHVLTYIFNTLVNDHSINDRIRSYKDPMSSRHLSNEISNETVSALITSCEENYDMVHKYYELKKKIIGLKKFYDYDRYAPISNDTKKFSYDKAKNIILNSFNEFSPKMAEVSNLFFNNNWIDAELRDGKRGGAFSHGTVPSVHPYVFTNYTGRTRDVMTLAHELGHGVHQYLSRKQGYFQFHTPLTTAETASVFAEMLVFHNLLRSGLSKKQKLSLICGKLEEIFATVFRQVVLTRFEQLLHNKRRNEGELTTEGINKLWIETNEAMYGKSVELTDNYGYWWLYIPHFIHSPFYCYAYSFGELLVFSLFNIYEKQGKKFIPKYINLLSSGGSEAPDELVKKVGVDINDPDFWNGGLNLIRNMVDNAFELAN